MHVILTILLHIHICVHVSIYIVVIIVIVIVVVIVDDDVEIDRKDSIDKGDEEGEKAKHTSLLPVLHTDGFLNTALQFQLHFLYLLQLQLLSLFLFNVRGCRNN